MNNEIKEFNFIAEIMPYLIAIVAVVTAVAMS